MNTFLITGASGFLGGILTEKLLKNGYKVVGMGRKRGFLSAEIINDENFTFVEWDLRNNFNERLENFNFDGIFHLASQQPYSNDLTYGDFHKGNVETTLSIMNFAKDKDVRFVVYTSSISLFGKQMGRKYIDENSIPVPADYYSITKYMAEEILEIGLRETRTKVIIIRYPSMFGKNHLGGLVHTYYRSAKEGRDIEVYGKGEKYRNLLYAEDAACVLLKIIENFNKLKKREIFVAGSKNSLKMSETAQIIKELLKSDSKIIGVDKPPSTDGDVFLDLSKAQRILDFDPMTIEDGLKLYIAEASNEI